MSAPTRTHSLEFSHTLMDVGDPTSQMPVTVYEGGNAESEQVVWYHQGLGSPFEIKWDALAAEIGTDARHLGFDPRGIRASKDSNIATPGPESLEQVADDTITIMDKLGIRSVDVVGHSLGGATAMLMASRHPERVHSLVVMDSVDQYHPKVSAAFLNRVLEIKNQGWGILDTVVPRAFGEEYRQAHPDIITAYTEALQAQDQDVYARYSQLAADLDITSTYPGDRTLFIVGEHDPSTRPENVRAVADKYGANYVEIPGAGHNPALEQPRLVAEAILNFTASLPPLSAA